MIQRALVVATLLLLAVCLPGPAFAEEKPASAEEKEEIETGLSALYPLVTRRPVLETVLEVHFTHEKASRERTTTTAFGLDYVVLPRWQLGLELPIVVNDPKDGPTNAGVGDISLENTFLLFRGHEDRSLVSAGFEVRLPSGSERRGLGGETTVEPFVSAGIAIDRFYLVGEVSYEWRLDALKANRSQEVGTQVALGYQIGRFIPMLELNTVTKTDGPDEGAEKRGRVQVYATPGLLWQIVHDTNLGVGVQLPLTDARAFDYAILGLFTRSF
jgi:outer membrane putative beta-barrel porin/alpha-amylase